MYISVYIDCNVPVLKLGQWNGSLVCVQEYMIKMFMPICVPCVHAHLCPMYCCPGGFWYKSLTNWNYVSVEIAMSTKDKKPTDPQLIIFSFKDLFMRIVNEYLLNKENAPHEHVWLKTVIDSQIDHNTVFCFSHVRRRGHSPGCKCWWK